MRKGGCSERGYRGVGARCRREGSGSGVLPNPSEEGEGYRCCLSRVKQDYAGIVAAHIMDAGWGGRLGHNLIRL